MEYYLCILDFEATCWENNENKEQMEIIEFPSVLYKITEKEDKSIIEFVGEFAEYVKPTRNTILTKFCTNLTGITQSTVDKADIIQNVYKRHRVWIANNVPINSRFIIGTCGHWDLATQLPREIKNKNLQKHSYYGKYINVKYEFQNFYKIKCGGMTDMLSKLNINLEGRHHSGIDDSRNTAQIMIRMINDGYKYSNMTINDVTDKKYIY
jgi:inhibitor of KinA sporulation pathway (predicted exonuclease)